MALPSRARSARLLVVTLVSVSLVTITVDYRQGDSGPLAAVGDGALAVISPLQEAVSKVTKPVGNFFSTLVRLPSIRKDNQDLRARVAELEGQAATSTDLTAQLNEAQALLGLQESLGPDIATTGAQVIANGVSNFEWTITIDKGSSDGIAEDMPVVAAAGLVGRVTRVAPDSASVQLIIDPDSYVAGRLDISRTTGLVGGEAEHDLRMGLVDTETDVQPGEQVVTAGYKIPGVAEGVFPPGILIGSVSRVLPNEADLEKYITIRPAVDFSTLDVVLVVLSGGSG
ncbi:MAG: rod shape-determining protein MreC [Solirubrobacterales bacterium]